MEFVVYRYIGRRLSYLLCIAIGCLRRKADTHYNYIGKSKQEKNEHRTCMNSFKIVLESNMSPRSHLNLCTVASAQFIKIPVFFTMMD